MRKDDGSGTAFNPTAVFDATIHGQFAEFSGDANPMHMDALAARRTAAGKPTVHGMHTLLWSLNEIAAVIVQGTRICSVRARFNTFLQVGETASLSISKRSETRIVLQVNANQNLICSLVVGLEPMAGVLSAATSAEPHEECDLSQPADLSFAQLRDRGGFVPAAVSRLSAEELFARASALIGPERVTALACVSRLVGMVCPGLHSLLSEVDLRFVAADGAGGIKYCVTDADERYQKISQRVSGSGIDGVVDCFRRSGPVSQISVADISRLVRPDEFAASVALVIGASRGLGEVVAKAIGAGGGRVIATYVAGRQECEQVAASITQVGGKCSTLAYDARLEADKQLANLPIAPTSIYYFATPHIFQAEGGVFARTRFQEFCAFYVQGFFELCEYARRARRQVSLFYPSSVAVESRPAGMTSYAMAKAAGEILCEDLNRQCPDLRIIVRRLPRLLTDQTAAIVPVDSDSAVELMLSVIREVE